jgi:transcriptional/translational regulatory protein YebC/TACO1
VIGKNGGKIAESGSVLFMYDRKGKIEVDSVVDEEALLDAAIENGVDDFELVEGDEEDTFIVYTEPADASAMAEAIKAMNKECKFALAYVTKAPMEVGDEDFESNMKIYDALMELDDVDSVEHNLSN